MSDPHYVTPTQTNLVLEDEFILLLSRLRKSQIKPQFSLSCLQKYATVAYPQQLSLSFFRCAIHSISRIFRQASGVRSSQKKILSIYFPKYSFFEVQLPGTATLKPLDFFYGDTGSNSI